MRLPYAFRIQLLPIPACDRCSGNTVVDKFPNIYLNTCYGYRRVMWLSMSALKLDQPRIKFPVSHLLAQ